MGVFGKVAGAQVTSKSGFFPLGVHEVNIVKTKVHVGHKGTNAIIEASVTATDAASADFKVGHTRAQVIGMGNVMGPINVKKFVLAATGLDPEDPEGETKACKLWASRLETKPLTFEEVCERLFDESANILEGLPIRLECINTRTQKNQDFTVHNWKPAHWDDLETV
jgi:hypothetical protein